MSGRTSQISTVLQSLSGLGIKLSSRLCQLLPGSSTTTLNSHLKRERSPSNSSLPKSKRQRKEPNEGPKGDLGGNQNLLKPGTGSHELLLSKTSDQPTQTLVREKFQQIPTQGTKDLISDKSFSHQTCLGTDKGVNKQLCKTPAVSSLHPSFESSTKTSSPQSCMLNLPQMLPEVSLCQNGNTFSKGSPSILTGSCRHSIVLQLMKRERLALEKQRLALEALKQSGRLNRVLNGLPLGDPLRGLLLSSLSIENESFSNTETILNDYLQPSDQVRMARSSCMTRELGMKLEEDKRSSSLITTTSPLSMQPRCRTTELNTDEAKNLVKEDNQIILRPKSAIDSIVTLDAASPTWDASINTRACHVDRVVMEKSIVESESREDKLGLRPKYLRQFLWSPESEMRLTASEWTEIADPLPRPPKSEYENSLAQQTLHERPDLFRVVSSIKVEVLDQLVKNHPGRRFVSSVLDGLREGFWPWAITSKEGYPITHDETKPIHLTAEKELFLKTQLEHEQSLNRISEEVEGGLLPGMYCMPSYVVPKPHSSGWRLVNDLSTGLFSLNSMVDHQLITGYPLDSLANFGELLLKRHQQKVGGRFVAWKSDISEAYHICPMHKLWQLKWGVRLLGKLYVDCANVFGGSASPAIFIAVNALIAWATKHERSIDDLIYVDDSFGTFTLTREAREQLGEELEECIRKLTKILQVL